MADVVSTDGSWDQVAWIDYWRALWSAPTQPGYSTLVREGLARLATFAAVLRDQATLVGGDAAATLASQALDQLRTYATIAGVTTDGAVLKSNVVDPLLASADSPLWQIGRAAETLGVSKLVPGWATFAAKAFKEKIADPLKAAAGTAGAAIERGIWRTIIPAALVTIAAILLIKRAGGAAPL